MGLFTLRCADSRHSRAKSASRITFGDNEIATDIQETTQICVMKRAILHLFYIYFINLHHFLFKQVINRNCYLTLIVIKIAAGKLIMVNDNYFHILYSNFLYLFWPIIIIRSKLYLCISKFYVSLYLITKFVRQSWIPMDSWWKMQRMRSSGIAATRRQYEKWSGASNPLRASYAHTRRSYQALFHDATQSTSSSGSARE